VCGVRGEEEEEGRGDQDVIGLCVGKAMCKVPVEGERELSGRW